MEDLVTLTIDHILENIGEEIYYYELWSAGELPFVGKSRIFGVEKDKHGTTRIKCEVIWGSDLWEAELNVEDFFTYGEDLRPLYFGPPPFEIHEISWMDESGEDHQRLIIICPGEYDFLFEDTVALVTSQPYTSKRVH